MINTDPKICVVIPVYNCEKYVGEAIESVLNQPYDNIRIILVNDGSVDASPEICDDYAVQQQRISVIHQKNGGVSRARNAGIEYVMEHFADTDYLAFLDADDKWNHNFIDTKTTELIGSRVDLLGFQSCNCNNAATRRNLPKNMQEGIFVGGAGSVWKHSAQHFAAMLYSIGLIREYSIRFDPDLKYSEDVIFRMQCIYLAKNIGLYNHLMYLYRHSATSAVHNRKYGIPYFTPIIDGWLRSDKNMEQYRNDIRATLWEGRAMAAVCIVDMLEEHYQHFGSKRDEEQLFRDKPQYLELITSKFAYNRPDSGLRWQAMVEHSLKFRMKCCAKGMMFSVLRSLYGFLRNIRPVAKWMDEIRYPLEDRV